MGRTPVRGRPRPAFGCCCINSGRARGARCGSGDPPHSNLTPALSRTARASAPRPSPPVARCRLPNWWAPAAVHRAGVHLNFGLQVRLGESVFYSRLVIRSTHIIIPGDRDQELRLALRGLQMWTIRHVRHEPATMEGADRSDAIGNSGSRPERHRTTHTIALRADLAVLGHRRLLIEPSEERFRVRHVRACLGLPPAESAGRWE